MKDKDFDFVLMGVDYVINMCVVLSGWLGVEYCRCKGVVDEMLFYVEFVVKVDYGKGLYLLVGYGFLVEEVFNFDVYIDMVVYWFFVNV